MSEQKKPSAAAVRIMEGLAAASCLGCRRGESIDDKDWHYSEADSLPSGACRAWALRARVGVIDAEIRPLLQRNSELERETYALVTLLRSLVTDATWKTLRLTDAGKKFQQYHEIAIAAKALFDPEASTSAEHREEELRLAVSECPGAGLLPEALREKSRSGRRLRRLPECFAHAGWKCAVKTPERWKCKDCLRITTSPLIAANPFDPQGANIWGCPRCYAIDQFVRVCDWDGCDEESTWGWESDSGYRNTCYTHGPIAASEAATDVK